MSLDVARGVVMIRANNPGPMTLDGTNTYVVADRSDGGAWVVDPGPDLPEHLVAVVAAANAVGGVAGIALTHDHGDHTDGLNTLLDLVGTEPPVVRFPADRAGPLTAIHTPGHAQDHLVFTVADVGFVGDLVLGQGSTIVPPGGGSMRAYLDSLERVRDLKLRVLLPGHGPVIENPDAKIAEYIAHRLDRERRVLEAIDSGVHDPDAIVRYAWSEVPAELLPAARYALEAHLEKLADEGRLPAAVEEFIP